MKLSQGWVIALRALAFCAVVGMDVFAPIARSDDTISPDLIRRIQLEWEAEDKAQSYQVQFGQSLDFENNLYDEKMATTRFQVDILPGAYFYRVRSIDKLGRLGRWTKVQEISINARPPKLLSPENGAFIQGDLPDSGLPLEWRTSGPGVKYLVEIKRADEDGKFSSTVVKQEFNGTTYPFFPKEPGKYQWNVHTIGPGGDEPGVPWEFTIEGVFIRPALLARGAVPVRVIRYVAPWWRGHWTFHARYGQAILNYSIIDNDFRASGSFSGLTGYTVATLNWEWHDPVKPIGRGIPWFEAELKFDRQTVLGESVLLPRKGGRVGAWFDEIVYGWRFSPIFEYAQREIAIYQPITPTKAVRANSIRNQIGLGLGVEYKLKSYLVLGAWGKMIMQSGGESGIFPVGGNFLTSNRSGLLQATNAIELGASGTMSLSSKAQVQGRLRYDAANEQWLGRFPPGSQTPDALTKVTLGNIAFDVGLGIKF